MVGPAFSGESEAADPIFEQAGLPTITPSATRPSLSDQGLEDLPPRRRQRLRRRARRRPTTSRTCMKAEKVFVVDDQSAYGAGLADEVKKVLGRAGRRHRQGARRSRPTSPRIVTKVKASGATVLFYGGYTAEAEPFLKQLARGRLDRHVRRRRRHQRRQHALRRPATPTSRAPSRPARAPRPTEAKGTFVADYKAKFNADAGRLRRRGVRPGEHLPGGHRGRQDHPRRPAGVPRRLQQGRRGHRRHLQVGRPTASWTRRRSRSGRSRSRPARGRRTRRSRRPDPIGASTVSARYGRCGRESISRPHRLVTASLGSPR